MSASRDLPGWMYSMESDESNPTEAVDDARALPLSHLLPRLREYLRLVDPNRVQKAEELLSFSSEDELFRYLETTYGNTVAVDTSSPPAGQHDGMSTMPSKSSRSSRSVSSASDKRKRPRSKSNEEAEDEDLSDFIVSDSEDDEVVEEDEEEEFQESESDVDEPEPDEDLKRRKRLVKPPPPRPIAQGAMPTRFPAGPTIVCKYGKACYRKNPVHFQEFAHPWLLNQPPSG